MAQVRRWQVVATYALPVAPGEVPVEETETIGVFDTLDEVFARLPMMYAMFEAIRASFADRPPWQGYSSMSLHVAIGPVYVEVEDVVPPRPA